VCNLRAIIAKARDDYMTYTDVLVFRQLLLGMYVEIRLGHLIEKSASFRIMGPAFKGFV
jgi:hypothetical protein